VVNLESDECQELMELFIKEKPEIWWVNLLLDPDWFNTE